MSERSSKGAETTVGGNGRGYSFGRFQLFPDRRLLLLANERAPIGSRAFDILALLVQRAGDLVTKAEIDAYVWRRTVVHESNLKVHVSALRKMLRSEPGGDEWISNLPGQGYCFTAPVSVEGQGGASMRRAVAARSGVLPRRRQLLGRADEVAALAAQVASQPLTTVIGPGGVGKTTLAIAAADLLAAQFASPPCFVDLSGLDEPHLTPHAIASALGLPTAAANPLGEIGDHLRASPRVLILDSCEHISSAVATAADQIAGCMGDAVILATSREPLRIRSEKVFRLSPLVCPMAARSMSAQHALSYPAVQLFVARAQEHSAFRFQDDDAVVVAGICRRLDGLPLALELAATRLDERTPSQLAELLDRSFHELEDKGGGIPRRHRGLTATLDWSYQLLSEIEARVFRAAGIFARHFTLEDINAILAPTGLGTADIVAGLEALVNKSFAQAEVSQGGRRYHLLETTRAYAVAQLEAQGEHAATRRAHAWHVVSVLERAEDEFNWRPTEDWTAAYTNRLDDLRRALIWTFDLHGDAEIGVRLVVAALPLWGALSAVAEYRPRVRQALELAPAGCDPKLRLKLVSSRAWTLTYAEHSSSGPEPPWREALRLAGEIGETEYELRALLGLATYETFTGRVPAAIDHLLAFKTRAEQTQHWDALPDALRLLGLARVYVGDVQSGGDELEQLAARIKQVETRARATQYAVDRYCIIRSSLAFSRWVRGRPSEALDAAAEAVAGAIAIDHAVSLGNSLIFAEIPLALWTGRLDRAEAGLASVHASPAIRGTAIWTPVVRFFDAALGQARGQAGAIDEMGTTLARLLETGFVTRAPMYLVMLAEGLIKTGRFIEADAPLAEAALRQERSGERWCRPEVLRLQAECLALGGDAPAAELRLRQAMTDAKEQGGLMFELRSASALARLLVARNEGRAAADILAPLCARFAHDEGDLSVRAARDILRLA